MADPETQLRRMERILAISHELISTASLETILHNIVQAAAELADCESVGILLLDEQPNTLRFIAATLFKDRLLNLPVPIDASIAGVAFSSAQPIKVPDASKDPRHYPKVGDLIGMPARSLLAVPLQFRERKIGVLEAENKRNDQVFDDVDVETLTALAVQTTIAIENARLIEKYEHLLRAEQTQRQMADALRRASAVVTNTLDYEQVIDRILDQVSQVIPSDTSNVMMIEAGDIARVFRGHGYAQFGTAETLTATTLNVSAVARLREMRETAKPIVIPNVTQDPVWVYSRPEHNWIRSYVGAPIIIHDQVVGFLNANSATLNLYSQMDAERLQAFAYHAATAIENARLYWQAQQEIVERSKVEKELRRHRDHLEELVKERTAELQRLAITDPLTTVFNRRHLFILGEQAFQQAQRYQHPLAVLMLDIDHFKQVNDQYGHMVGDQALKKLAEYLSNHLRAADILGRYGGEEFIVLMPETDLDTARQTAERLREGLRTLTLDTERTRVGLTVTIGIALLDHHHDTAIDLLIQRADQAMYAAKQAGRDRVMVFEAKHSA